MSSCLDPTQAKGKKNEARVDISIPVEYVQSSEEKFPLPFLRMNPTNQRALQYLFLRIADS
jgi:hypothetical protein